MFVLLGSFYLLLQNLYLAFLVVELIMLLFDSLQQISDGFFLGFNHLLKNDTVKTVKERKKKYKKNVRFFTLKQPVKSGFKFS